MIVRCAAPVAFLLLLAAVPAGAQAPADVAPPAVVAPPAESESRVEIAPHRASYRLRLKTTAPDSRIASVSGAVAFEWADACDGWAINQLYLLRISEGEGETALVKDNYSSWESKDGLHYRFSVTRGVGGEETERIAGEARLPAPGAAGNATFTHPEPTARKLPPGTVFPSAHTLALLAAAQAGKRFTRHTVFDGASVDGADTVSATILEPQAAPPLSSSFPADLLQATVWPMFLAFYRLDAQEAAPNFELTIFMQANGIATRIGLDFGDFALDGELDALEALPRSDC